MRRHPLPAILLLLASLSAPAPGQVAAASGALGGPPSAEAWMRELGAAGRRLEGSAAEGAVLERLAELASEAGLEARILPLDRLPGAHSYSRSLSIRLPGALPDRLVFLAPLDASLGGPAGEGDAALALLLGQVLRLGRELSEGRLLPLGIEAVFLGAEARAAEGAGPGLGSRAWIEGAGADRVAAFYLSMDGLPAALELGNAGRRILSPFWHYDRARSALAGSGFAYRLRANRMQVYRLGLADRPGPLPPYLEAGIPAVELRGLPGGPAETGRAEERFAALVEGLIAANAGGFLEGWDRNYLSFQVGSRSIVVQEGPYIAFLLALTALAAALVLAFTVIRRGEAKAFLSRLPRQSGQILLLYLAASLSYLSAFLAQAAERALLGSPEVFRVSPSLFGAARLLVSFSLFLSLLSFLVGRRILSPDPRFYEFAALVCLALDVFVFSALMPPLSFYFVWAFMIVGLSLLLGKALASLLAYLLMYAPLLLLVLELAAFPELAILDPIVRPDLGIGLLVAATALPFYAFTASPLLFYSRAGPRARNRTALLFAGLALLAEGGLVLAALPRAKAAPLLLRETIDQGKGSLELELASAGRLGRPALSRGGRPIALEAAGEGAGYRGREEASLVGFQVRNLPFLDRTSRRISLEFRKAPYALALRVDGEGELRVHDCSLPYEISFEGRAAEVFVGRNPPNPLVFELTTARDFSARLSLEASYLEAFEPYAEEGGRPLRVERSLLRASFPFGEPGAAP